MSPEQGRSARTNKQQFLQVTNEYSLHDLHYTSKDFGLAARPSYRGGGAALAGCFSVRCGRYLFMSL